MTTVCKFNVGTELRMAFGTALRDAVNRDPARFDRNQILSETIDPVAGHVPGARNHPFPGNLGVDGRFLPAAELRRR